MAENEGTFQLVTFQLGVESYGINIMDVKEIYSLQEVRDIPNAPAYVEGIFNLRGEIIPVINLHKRFNLERAKLTEDEKLLSGFIIINLNGMRLGIIIDKVQRVITVDRSLIQPPPQMVSGIGTEYIQGVYHQDNGYLIILDINRLFDRDELKQIGYMQQGM